MAPPSLKGNENIEANVPRHIAIIMDGNGRWAKKHLVSVASGHRRGVETLREIIRHCSHSGVQVLSIYAFSTENWTRPEMEIAALMALILEFFKTEIDELDQNGVKIRIIGDKAGLPPAQAEAVSDAERRTMHNAGLQLNIALNYGARDEILRAVKHLMDKAVRGECSADSLDAEAFSHELYTYGQPDVDLLIRTSGEMRLSNFLLYQCAYAELVFPEVLWPDFSVEHFLSALEGYATRERRFGGRKS